jgi:glycosyltransferase involved in cell wall biosynthesis
MRILIISYFFPPYNAIGGVRVGKQAKFLERFGHEVRVITAADQPLQPTLPLEIAPHAVQHTRWWNVNRPAELAFGGRGRVAERGYTAGSGGGALRQVGALYKSVLNFPDGEIGWFPFARAAALRVAREWRPDVIYASARPITSLLVAHSVAAACGVPWVAELRDLWVDNPYYSHPAWRAAVERRLEKRVLGSAAGFVTVSEPLAETLREKFGRPTEVVMNGFDAEDYPADRDAPPAGPTLRIAYTGMIYAGKRDPSPLFAALQRMGSGREQVRVSFYGRYLETVRELADRFGVGHLVEVRNPVAYAEALRIQRESDLLLLLLWDDPSERGVFTGKLFEYIGARRPILAIGPRDNVAAQLVEDRGVGGVFRDPDEIARHLEDCLRQKRTAGGIGMLAEEVTRDLSREAQTRRLESFLSGLVGDLS